MNTTKLLAPVVAALAFVSVIGLAYAQSDVNTTAAPATSSGTDSMYVAPMMDASAMPQPSTNSATDAAPVDSGVPMTERAARTDRN